ncbi:unnamed protein product [Rotaria sp. Silwood1]|nr:unnamed protein product [Rotaria sp. Silwood1]CAF0742610.1 unnamed protein product [Rotaria sp. Silwood1]CAF3359821.1 unnamed protein product [Rotaria sp. Silwood1]CAF4585882.1 unnamed protein product [Rotaria sp. Silwood1]
MAKEKASFGKRLSQFLSKMFWHLNQPVVPTYTYPNRKNSTSSSNKSIKKVQVKSSYQISPIDVNHLHPHFSPRYRTALARPRAPILTSIQEE